MTEQERCEAWDSVGRCVLPKGHAEGHDHGYYVTERGKREATARRTSPPDWKAAWEAAESRVQELEGERDELNDACRELQERNMMEACDECNDREEAAIARG
jgi:DNA-binding PadR family transcriptional regulator